MLSVIGAIGKNRELGKNNGLLWSIPEDMRHFRDITRGHTVIMGQRTFESIGRPLPNRTNIVMTQETVFAPEGVLVANSPEEALALARQMKNEFFSFPPLQRGGGESASRRGLDLESPPCPKTDISPLAGGEDKEREVFVIGGAMVYSLFLPQCDKLYLTLIDADFPDADVFFPEYKGLFHEVSRQESQDERYQYAFTVWEKTYGS